MRIEIVCGGGSTNGVVPSDIYGENGRIGVGGAELGLLTMCKAWKDAGHEVILYNNPKKPSEDFEQRGYAEFDKTGANKDIVIFFREPTPNVYRCNGKKVFWSCDQLTVGDFRHFAQFVDQVVTISKFHSDFFLRKYEIRDTTYIDLPVRTWEYEKPVQKIKNKVIFTSVPDRGLELMVRIWPKIVEKNPLASLTITSDYRLWGAASPLNSAHVQKFINMPNVKFLGAVNRARLIQEQLQAQIHLYPCTYDELFCIAIAESQVAGALPIASTTGALNTTNMGVAVHGNPRDTSAQELFVERTLHYLQDAPDIENIQKIVKERAIERFSPENIVKQWEEKVFNK